MPHTPECVLFDLDGTLIDTAPDFHWVINQLLKEEDKPEVQYDFLRAFVSNGARAMVQAAFDLKDNDKNFSRLHQRMLDIYLGHLDVHSQLFPGLQECLNWLKANEIPWGIVTNKPQLYALPVMRGLNLDQDAACIICPDHVSQKKPHPEALYLACTQISCNPSNSIYVGDHIRDIEAGRNAGMTTIAATYGYLDQNEDPADWHADLYIDCATQLQPLLQSINTQSI